MKKLVLVLGLIIGSFLAPDALAAVSFNTSETSIVKDDKPRKDKKKKSKKHCKTEATDVSKSKGCSKEASSCCSKKKTTETPKETPAN